MSLSDTHKKTPDKQADLTSFTWGVQKTLVVITRRVSTGSPFHQRMLRAVSTHVAPSLLVPRAC